MFKTFTAAVLAVSFAGAAMAEERKADGFLKASSAAQVSYINTSLTMAQHLLSKSQGECISKWSKANEPNGYKLILDISQRNPDVHPSAIVVAVIEKECGHLALAQR